MSIPPADRRLDLSKLRVFLEVTRTGNFTVAARRLHVTQSAVSHAIRSLEASIGRELIAWQRRRFTLTDEGRYLQETCERVFRDLDEAERVLGPASTGLPQVLTIGVTVEFGTSILVRKLRPLLEATPWLRVQFRFRDDLAPLLLRDDIDAAVDCRPHSHPSILATGLFREKYVIVASPAFLEGHPVHRPMDLERVPVISPERGGTWWANALRTFPGRQRPVLQDVVEVDQVRGMVHAALEGYGVALLPKYTVLAPVERGELVVLFPKLRLLEDWFCLYQKQIHAARDKNRVLTEFLSQLDMTEFGDAIKRVAEPR